MEADERTLWNRKYSEHSHTSLEPDPFLVSAYSESIAGSAPGSALDVAGGVGRHTLWLAERGWKVKLVDVSEIGIEFARKNLMERRDGAQRGKPQGISVDRSRPRPRLPRVPSKIVAQGKEVKAVVQPTGLPSGAGGGLEAPQAVELSVVNLEEVPDLGHAQYDLVLVFFYLQRSLFPALISCLKPRGFLIYKTYTLEQQRFSGGPSHPMHLLKSNELLQAFASLQILYYHETIRERGLAELVARKP